MSIKYYANRVKESTTTNGTGNLILSGAILGYRSFSQVIGANNKLSYYIYRIDNDFEWEIGTGYILSSGGVDQLVRESVIASSSANSLVSFSAGTKFVETILSQERINTSFINTELKSTNFTASEIPALYIIDASAGNIQVSLPSVVNKDPIVLGFLLNKTIGNQYEQINAIQIIPSGTETINGTTSETLYLLSDYIQIVSVPSQSGWFSLDPIQELTSPYGFNGTVQLVNNQSFSGVPSFNWNSTNSSLQIGGTGNLSTADVIIPTSGGTIVFNEQSLDKDFRVEGSGSTHLLFVDASTNRIGINNSNPQNILHIATSQNSGLLIESSGSGPILAIKNSSVSGIIANDRIGSVVFSGLNTSNIGVPYSTISSYIESPTNGSEKSSIRMSILDNGVAKDNLVLSTDGISIGSDSDNIDGIVVGLFSENVGQNIQIGYTNTSFASNSVLVGNDNVLSSGSTNCGIIGNDHSVSGNYIWVIGGTGLSTTSSNSTYLCYNNDKYIKISQSGDISYNTKVNDNINFNIVNTSLLSSGIKENIQLSFMNSSNVLKTGLVLQNQIDSLTSGSENTTHKAFVLIDGSLYNILSLGKNNCMVGDHISSGVNIMYGSSNAALSSGNIIYGSNILSSGIHNVLVGRNIYCSGNGALVFGSNINALVSGVVSTGIVILGNNNDAFKNYAVSIGNYNTSSGLYSVSMGYDNGAHGDYSVAIGENNTVIANGSVAVGRNNILDNSAFFASIFAVGHGNYSDITDTGVMVGYSNSIYGSGGIIFGQSSSSSGLNNIVCGMNSSAIGLNNIILGNSSSISGNNSILLGNSKTLNANSTFGIYYNNIVLSGVNNTNIDTNASLNLTASTGISIVAGTGVSIVGYSGINILSPNGSPISIVAGSGSSVNSISTTGNKITVIGNSGIDLIATSGSIITLSSVSGSLINRISTSGNIINIISSNGISVSGNIESVSSISATGNIVGNTGIFNNLSCIHASSHYANGSDPIQAIINTQVAISGTVNNWLPSGNADVLRISTVSETGIITGIDSAYGINRFTLVNVGTSGVIELVPQSLNSIGANRFITFSSYTGVIQPSGGSMMVVRDTVDNRWRVLSNIVP